MKILITSPAFCQPCMKKMIKYIKGWADEVIVNPHGRTLNKEEVLKLWQGCDGIIAGVELYTKDILQKAPDSLKVISRYGSGYESINIKAAGDKGIKVTNTPNVNADAVADLTLGLIISIARRIPQYDNRTRQGKWSRYVGDGLNGKTLGIVGLGAIGKKVAKRAKGFDMKLTAFDPYFDNEYAKEMGIKQVSLEELFKDSDFMTLHVPVLKDTEKMINRKTLSIMKKDSYLINAARGKLVEEDALYDALKNKQITGAALDVFENEPLKESKLFQLENIVVLPHLGGHTKEAENGMAQLSIDNTLSILKEQYCENIVNKQYLK